MSYTIAQLHEMYPHLNDKLIAQLASDNGAWDAEVTHPEVWMPGNALDYFLSTGAIAVKGTTKRPAWLDDTSHYGTALPQYKQRPDTYPNGR